MTQPPPVQASGTARTGRCRRPAPSTPSCFVTGPAMDLEHTVPGVVLVAAPAGVTGCGSPAEPSGDAAETSPPLRHRRASPLPRRGRRPPPSRRLRRLRDRCRSRSRMSRTTSRTPSLLVRRSPGPTGTRNRTPSPAGSPRCMEPSGAPPERSPRRPGTSPESWRSPGTCCSPHPVPHHGQPGPGRHLHPGRAPRIGAPVYREAAARLISRLFSGCVGRLLPECTDRRSSIWRALSSTGACSRSQRTPSLQGGVVRLPS